MPKPTPEQNRNNVQAGDRWQANKTGRQFIVNDIEHEDGIWYALVGREGTGIDGRIRLDRLKNSKPGSKAGYTRLSVGGIVS